MDLKNKDNWRWMQEHMPTVVAMLKREREKGGGALIGECWRRGVIEQEPGWFYAAENGVTVGVPSVEFLKDPTQAALAAMFPKRALLMLKGAMAAPVETSAGQDDAPALTRGQRRAQEIVNG